MPDSKAAVGSLRGSQARKAGCLLGDSVASTPHSIRRSPTSSPYPTGTNRTSRTPDSAAAKARRRSPSSASAVRSGAVSGVNGVIVSVAVSSARAIRQVPRQKPSRSMVPTVPPLPGGNGTRRASVMTRQRLAYASRRLSYSGRKRGGAGVSGSGRGASGRSNSSAPASSRKVRSCGRRRSTTSRSRVSPD